jgi:hypothetical protein
MTSSPQPASTGLSDATELFSDQGITVHMIGDPPTVVLTRGGHSFTTSLADLDNALEHAELRLDKGRSGHLWRDADHHDGERLRHRRDCLVIAKYAIAAARERQQHHQLGQSLAYRRVDALRDDALTIINRADELLAQQTDKTATQTSLLSRLRRAI